MPKRQLQLLSDFRTLLTFGLPQLSHKMGNFAILKYNRNGVVRKIKAE